eukprot:TRINITY_DN91256_c0_g1_i1.p1 TRINITY_DN91256_c0_g1~~TRINITY_DN91256_c0_g1_i1.p1  ORF type:complete len:571 (-),score=125.84 TRINITY_DN91256_c0_g1_i1:153-1865(-)
MAAGTIGAHNALVPVAGVQDAATQGGASSVPDGSGEEDAAARIQESLQRNRLLQEQLRNALALTGLARLENQEQERRLTSYIQTKKPPQRKKIIPATTKFGYSTETKSHLPKNAHALKRLIFCEKMGIDPYPHKFREQLWSQEEERVLEEILLKELKRAAFSRLYTQRKMALGRTATTAQGQAIFASLTKDMQQSTLAELLQIEGFKTDWVRVSRALKQRGYSREAKSCYVHFFSRLDPNLSHGPFTKLEDKAILMLAAQHGNFEWNEVAKQLGTGRTAWSCFQRFQQVLNPKIGATSWSPAECAVHRFWSSMVNPGQHGPDVSARLGLECFDSAQCLMKWNRSLWPGMRRGGCSHAETRRLQLATQVYGRGNHHMIGRHMKGRSVSSTGHHSSTMKFQGLTRYPKFTPEEDEVLLAAVEKYGINNWSLMKLDLPGRTAAMLSRQLTKLRPELAEMQIRLRLSMRKWLPNACKTKTRSELNAADFVLKLNEESVEHTARNGKSFTYKKVCLDGEAPVQGVRSLNRIRKRRAEAAQQLALANAAETSENEKAAPREAVPPRSKRRHRHSDE